MPPLPLSRDYSGIDLSSQVQAATWNSIQDYIAHLYNSDRSVKGLVLDASGNAIFSRGAQSPLLLAENVAGSPRALFDYLGLPLDRLGRWQELWDWTINVSGAQALTLPAANYARWTIDMTGGVLNTSGGTNTGFNDTSPFCFQQCTGSGLHNRMISSGITTPIASTSIGAVFEALADASGTAASTLFKVGLSTSSSGDVTVSSNSVGFCKRAADTTWQAFTSGASQTFVDTGVVFNAAGAATQFRLELHGSSSPYGAIAIFYVNGTRFTISTNLPTTTGVMGWAQSIECVGAGASNLLKVGQVQCAWNRLASPLVGL